MFGQQLDDRVGVGSVERIVASMCKGTTSFVVYQKVPLSRDERKLRFAIDEIKIKS